MKEFIKLNLGCGPSGIDGWLNYDWGLLPILGKYPIIRGLIIKMGWLSKDYDVSWPSIKLVDIRKKLPLEDHSIAFIYCSHVLEHFERWEAESILRECRRVLKKNGILRVVLPDLRKMVLNYKNADEFGREFWGFDKDKKWGFSGKFIRGHEWMYDTKSAKQLLKEAGFKNIMLCSFRKGSVPNLESLDIEQHYKISLYLEASDRN